MEYFVWDIDPVLLHLGPLQLRWYGLLFVGGFFAGAAVLKWIYKREGKNPDDVDNLLIYLMIGAVIGARLVHTLFYEPEYYLSHPFEILYVWKGGLASHGGLLGVIIGAYLFCKKYNESFTWLLSRLTIAGSLAAVFVRVANFFNTEIVGIKTDVPWAVVFQRYTDQAPRHPVQLYEAFAYLTIFFVLLGVYKKISPSLATKLLPGLFLSMFFTARFVLEFFKTRQSVHTADSFLSTGQLLSIPYILIGVVWVVWAIASTGKEDR